MIPVLDERIAFPAPSSATEDGVVAIGGDVCPERLLLAYQSGIFPWPIRGYPLVWFSPDPRFVLSLPDAHVGRSLRKAVRKRAFEIRADTAFREVVRRCADVPRPNQAGTWITDAIIDGYCALHELGYAHSIEAYQDEALVGGLYGVSLGGSFFGESMFSVQPDASKVCFATLLGNLCAWGFTMVDCQVHTSHLERFGAAQWDRRRFLRALAISTQRPTRVGNWELPLQGGDALSAIDAMR